MALSPKQKRIIKIVSIVIAIAIIVGIIIFGVVIALTGKTVSSLGSADQSQDRLATIDSVLTSIFGPKWVAILITFAVVLLVFFFLLYLLTKKDIAVGDSGAKIIGRSMIGLAIVVSLAILVVTIISLIEYFQTRKALNDQAGDFLEKTKAQQTLEIAGVIIAVLVVAGLGIGGYMWWRRRKKASK